MSDYLLLSGLCVCGPILTNFSNEGSTCWDRDANKLGLCLTDLLITEIMLKAFSAVL